MRHAFTRLMLCLLCLVMLCPAAFAEDAASPDAGETVIAAAHPVPDYVERLLEMARHEIGYQEERGGQTKYGICHRGLCKYLGDFEEKVEKQLNLLANK